ncbi:MAG: hypothetical protein N3A65_01545 [candidate division WOR-3 bacterium]|nr:hypothetical protein [candidate division WOR-3 bacterium]
MILLLLFADIGFEYLLVDPIAERTGMGYAIYGDGHNIHYNPAGMVFNDGTSYSFSYMNYIAGTHFGHIDYESKILGLGIRYFYSGQIKKTDALGQELGDFSTSFIDLNIGKGLMMNKIPLGIAGKIVYQMIDTLYSLGAGMDIGIMYFLEENNIQLGLTAKNLGMCIKPFIDVKELLPYEINLGMIYSSKTSYLGFDIVKPVLMNLGVRIGGGYNFTQSFTVRCSYNSLLSQIKTDTGLDFLAGITLGFGIKNGRIHINYAYTPYFSLGQAHRLTIRIGG